jgi:hypothetical protein
MQMTKPMFQPAPRPRPLTNSGDAQQLAAASVDLGFTRPSTAPTPEVRRDPPTPEPVTPTAQAPKSPIALGKGAALKFEVPDEVWTALRQEALNRRVTVKYLVLEALAAKGYNVNLSDVPEDGRRLR